MSRLTVITACLVAGLSLVACSNPAAPQGNYGSIAGTITSTSGQPIAGATISVDYTITATSAPDGKYLVQGVPITSQNAPAVVQVTQAMGYQLPAPRTDVQVQAGQTTQGVNFTLPPT